MKAMWFAFVVAVAAFGCSDGSSDDRQDHLVDMGKVSDGTNGAVVDGVLHFGDGLGAIRIGVAAPTGYHLATVEVVFRGGPLRVFADRLGPDGITQAAEFHTVAASATPQAVDVALVDAVNGNYNTISLLPAARDDGQVSDINLVFER